MVMESEMTLTRSGISRLMISEMVPPGGSIIVRGDQLLTIIDAPDLADGVQIIADSRGGSTPAEILVSGGAEFLSLSAGDDVIVTVGSVSLEVIVGPVEVTLVGDDGTTATLSAVVKPIVPFLLRALHVKTVSSVL